MKVTPKPHPGTTTVTKTSEGMVELFHSQGIKQSANYQSADVTYGVKMQVPDNDKAIKAGLRRAESIVEDALVLKVREQRKVLSALK